MNKLITITALALLTSSAWAHHEHFGDNPDMYQSPITEHGPGAPTGSVQKGIGDQYASHLANPEDVASNPAAKADPYDRTTAWKSQGDEYQSVIFDNQK